jgi:hypothetical protein
MGRFFLELRRNTGYLGSHPMRIVRRHNAWHVYFTRRALWWAVIAVVLAVVVVTAIATFLHFTRTGIERLAELE